MDSDREHSSVQNLVHQSCDFRARFLDAMQCSGDLFDKNMQCVTYILALRKEIVDLKASAKSDKMVGCRLCGRVIFYITHHSHSCIAD